MVEARAIISVCTVIAFLLLIAGIALLPSSSLTSIYTADSLRRSVTGKERHDKPAQTARVNTSRALTDFNSRIHTAEAIGSTQDAVAFGGLICGVGAHRVVVPREWSSEVAGG